jgi:hypothetical protein
MDLISLMFVFIGTILLIITSACLVIEIFKRKKWE